MRLIKLGIAAAGIAALFATWPVNNVAAQEYPNKPIHVICAYPAGAPPDILVRYFAEAIRKVSGATVVVENRPGALTNIAAQFVARSKPDGHTIFVASGNSFAANVHLFKELPYDPVKDFTPVSTISRGPFLFAVSADSPHKTLQDLTAALKKKTTPVKFGYSSAISLATAQLYNAKAGIEGPVAVSYRGSPDVAAGVAQNEIDYMMADISLVSAPGSKIKALALTTAARSSLAPSIPTSKEGGVDDFDLGQWWGIWLPAATPKDVVAKIDSWIDQGLAGDDFRKFINSLGSEPWLALKGEAQQAFMIAEIKKWGEAISLSKIEKQ